MSSIIEQAIQLEVVAEAHYRKAARQTTDGSASKILGALADEESAHSAILRGVDSTIEGSHLIEEARSWIRGVVEGGLPAISPDAGLVDVLRRAMEIEQETESFYCEHAATADSSAAASLFAKLAELERQHYLLVGSWVEYFDRPREWVESAEFGLREEY